MIAVVVLLIVLVSALLAPAFGFGQELPVFEIFLVCALFVVFFAGGVYIAAALGILGLTIGLLFSDRQFWLFSSEIFWGLSSNFIFVAVPLFLLMGEILLRSGLSEQLFRSLNVWFRGVPGGLLHTNVVACGVFSAVSGSSVATAATIASVALPYFAKTDYNPRLVLGTLAAGGALGNLIPPGIVFIVYAMLTDTSVGQLYVAAVVPAAMVLLFFMAVILVHAWLKGSPAESAVVGWRERLTSLPQLLPTAALIVVVLGSIYGGFATPTEAAALGVVGAAAVALLGGRLSLAMVNESAMAAVRNTALIGVILFGAFFLNFILTTLRVPQALAALVGSLPLPPWAVVAVIIAFYIGLGTFMESFSVVITTVPIVFPIVTALGYDPVWFGVVVVMLTEIALISPPDGIVMYVLQGMRVTPGPITDVFVGVTPFFLVYVVAVFVLLAAPDLALWLPRVMGWGP